MSRPAASPSIPRGAWLALAGAAAVSLWTLAGQASDLMASWRPENRDNGAHVMAMARIDPVATREHLRRAAAQCLRDLLPAEERDVARVHPFLVDALVDGAAFWTTWREGTDREAWDAERVRRAAAAQERYNGAWDAMGEADLATARALRARIAGGADPRPCVTERTAAKRWRVYAAPDPHGGAARPAAAEGGAVAVSLRGAIAADDGGGVAR